MTDARTDAQRRSDEWLDRQRALLGRRIVLAERVGSVPAGTVFWTLETGVDIT